MQKKIWLSALEKDEAKVSKFYQSLQRYGLAVDGHFWSTGKDNLDWANVVPELIKPDISIWMIMGGKEQLADEAVRIGLSLSSVALHAARGHGFPIILVTDPAAVEADQLPTPLAGAEVLAPDNPSLGAKVVARANMPVPAVASEYRLDMHLVPGLKLWIEAGPASGHTWSGAMFGVEGATIDAHGVGPAGTLPERAVLNYPMKGLKISVGETEYEAWAVKNELPESQSYFIHMASPPRSILFGSFSENDEAEVFRLRLV